MDDTGSTDGPRRRRGRAVGLIAAGVVAGGILAGTLSAAAQSTSTSPTPSTTSTSGDHRGPCRGETLLTGATAQKVKAAAEAAVRGGTVLRVETDSDGSPYEAHVRKSDGTEVVVKVDKSFKVTKIETHDANPNTNTSTSA